MPMSDRAEDEPGTPPLSALQLVPTELRRQYDTLLCSCTRGTVAAEYLAARSQLSSYARLSM